MTSWKLHLLYLGLGVVLFVAGRYTATSAGAPGRSLASVEVEKRILGAVEFVEFGDGKGLAFFAKVDSGAETASIHATDIKTFRKAGKTLVTFTTRDDTGKVQHLTREVSKQDLVESASGAAVRIFIKERIWIGAEAYDVEVNLANRDHLRRKFLIGKNVLRAGNYLIDTTMNLQESRGPASLAFIQEP
jgi:hypothetical protein